MTEEQVFLTALEQPTQADRTAYLETACGGDAELRRLVEGLLAAHFKSGDFLDEPVGQQLRADPTTAGAAETMYVPGDSGDEAVANEKNVEEEPDDLHFLEPSTGPDSLGRIGHYDVLEVLGKGGFGIVFRAFDDVLQRVVALKVLAPALAATSPARKRFLREARSSAQVRHDNVVQVHAVEEKPLPYLVMEFIAGETLQQRLDRKGPLEPVAIVSLGRQIAQGLAAAHATGLIHRDIKPGNILIEGGASERVKITDFGLARAADDASMTQSGMVAGTPMYMAPEQAKGETLDQRADLFSLGSVLYVMVSGRPPFRAATTFAVLKRVVEEDPRPIQDLIPETPEWLCDIIAKLHAKNPADRFQSAAEVVQALDESLAYLRDPARAPRPKVVVAPVTRGPHGANLPAAQRRGAWGWLAVIAALCLIPTLGCLLLIAAFVIPAYQAHQADVVRRLSDLPDGTQESPLNVSPASLPPLVVDEWMSLFNGTDLTGWKQDGYWMVEDGMLVSRIPAAPKTQPGFLTTNRGDFRDFHLRVEAKINAAGDSGLFFRFGEQGDASLQAQIVPSPNHAGSLLRHADVVVPATLSIKPDTWFTMEVIAQGAQVEVLIDGQQASQWSYPSGSIHSGPIALESGFPKTDFVVRKVEVMPLSPSSAVVRRPLPQTISIAAQQVEEVRKELQRLNPNFDGQVGHRIEDDVVVAFSFVTDHVTDISPVRALTGLKSLSCSASDVGLGQLSAAALLPLKGLPLTQLDCRDSPALSDLSALAGMKLTTLDCRATGVGDADLQHLAGMNDLQMLSLWGTKVTDAGLKELAGLKNLRHLSLQTTQVTDAGLKEIVGLDKLVYLDLYAVSGVTDAGLEHLARLKTLKHLDLRGPTVKDADVDKLASARPALRILTWERVIEPKVVPFTDADAQRIAGLPANEQVEEVRKELVRLNPGFDGKLTPTIENGVVTELSVNTDHVDNIAPVRALAGLIYLDCRGTYPNKGKLSELSPIKGMKLSHIDCSSTQIADLTPLADMPLTNLQFNHNPVDDLTPLQKMPLETLGCAETKVSDFSPLRGLKLRVLGAQLLAVTDLSPLEGMPLTGIDLYHTIGVTSLAPLKGMPLDGLNLQDVPVSDLSPLAGMTTLRTLLLQGTKVSDLSPLTGLKLTDLFLRDKQITDLSPLKGMPLSRLGINGSGVSDVTPLQGMPLAELWLDVKNITQGLDILRDIKSLKTIGIADDRAWPPEEFWELYNSGEFKK